MTPTIFPCYAAADREIAAGIAAFLERGADVRVFLEEGEMRPGEDMAQKAREGRTADMVLVLFSHHSLPPRWPRAQWEDALVHEPAEEGVRIAFVKCDDCAAPRVLVPQFELDARALVGLRQVKRWVRHKAATYTPPVNLCGFAGAGDLEVLGIAIADRPGTETVDSPALAFAFARAYREDFDAILALECGDRTLPALAGDLAAQLGLRLEGDLEANLGRLGDFCSARRFLLLLLDVRTSAFPDLLFGGHCSTLIATGALPELVSMDPLRQIQHAFTHLDPDADWSELCRLARAGRRLTREQGRFAECYELIEQWHAAAELCGDSAVLDESAREMVWILEAWGRTGEARRLEYRRASEFDKQMMLPF
jgi:hypothetical protein